MRRTPTRACRVPPPARLFLARRRYLFAEAGHAAQLAHVQVGQQGGLLTQQAAGREGGTEQSLLSCLAVARRAAEAGTRQRHRFCGPRRTCDLRTTVVPPPTGLTHDMACIATPAQAALGEGAKTRGHGAAHSATQNRTHGGGCSPAQAVLGDAQPRGQELPALGQHAGLHSRAVSGGAGRGFEARLAGCSTGGAVGEMRLVMRRAACFA